MNEQPEPPRSPTGDLDTAVKQVRHRLPTADRGKVTLVDVVKRIARLALGRANHVARDRAPRLHGRLPNAWGRAAVPLQRVREIPDHEDFRMARDREVVLHDHLTGLRQRHAERAPEWRRGIPRDVQPVVAVYQTAAGVGSVNVGEQHRGVALTAEEVADRARAVARRECGGRNLI